MQFVKKDEPPVDYEGDAMQNALDAATLEELDELEVLLHSCDSCDHCLRVDKIHLPL